MILPSKYKSKIAKLFCFHIFLSLLEVASISSIFPLLFIVTDPDVVLRPSRTQAIYDFFGFTSHAFFFSVLVIFFAFGVVVIYSYKLWLHFSTFTFLAALQRYVEERKYQQLISTLPNDSDSSHPAQESHRQFFLAQRYISYIKNLLAITRTSVALALVVGLLAWHDWRFIVVLGFGGALYYLIVFRFFRKRSTNLDEEEILQRGGLIQFWQETSQIRQLFVFGTSSKKHLQHFTQLQNNIQDVRYRRDMYRFLPRILLETVFILGVLAFVLYTFSIGMISSVPFLVLFGAAGLRALIAIDGIYQGCMGLSVLGDIRGEILPLLNPQNSKNEHTHSDTFVSIGLGKVSFGYSPKLQIFHELDFELGRGSSVCILGKSGVGKTTFLELLSGMRGPASGDFFLNKKSFTGRLYESITIGFVAQGGYIFTGSLQDNITLSDASEVDNKRLEDVVQTAFIDDFLPTLEYGYDTPLGVDGMRLSAGQRHRILLARELYRNPDILFLDEVTNGLDHDMTERIVHNLIDLRITLIFTTHKEWLSKYFDVTYAIEDKKLIQKQS